MQGVGFRPYVYRLASELGLGGWVLNDERGVLIEVEGAPARGRALPGRAGRGGAAAGGGRARAREERAAIGERGFAIVASERRRRAGAPGLAGHRDLRRLPRRSCFDPGDRRYRYPFINCTNCGPRFTIVARRPLRPAADDDGRLRDVRGLPGGVRGPARPPLPRPAERVPRLRAAARCSTRRRGRRAGAADAVAAAAARAARRADRRGQGLGGYHLACRADDEAAVAALRARKHREDKPFALMAPDLDAAARAGRARRGRGGAAALARSARSCSPARAPGAGVAPRSRPRRRDLGVMLPYSPLHHLLLADVGRAAGDDQRQRLRRADRLPRRRGARAARGDRRPVPRSTTARSTSRTDDSVRARRRRAAGRCCCAARAATSRRSSRCPVAARRRCSPAAPS